MFQIICSYSQHVTATFAEKYREFIVVLRPFGLSRSPYATGNKAANHVWQIYSAEKAVRRNMCGIEQGVGSYD
jgi:hypothetical protein